MKKIISIFLILAAGALSLSSQNRPNEKKILLTDSYGDSILLDLDNIAGPMVFIVYGPGCGVCLKELNAISEKVDAWQNLYHATIIAFSRNYDRSYGRKISKMKEKYGYTFPLYIDNKGELANFLGSCDGIDTDYFSSIGSLHLMIPQTVVLSKDGKVVFQKHGYHADDEDKIEAVLKAL
jgi:peroxiredoxin